MTVNDRKSNISCLNILVDHCKNTYHHSINKNLLMLIIMISLKKLRPILQLLTLELESLSMRIF